MTQVAYGAGLAACAEGQRLLSRDWSQHPLGAIENWNEGLLATLGQLLPSPIATVVIWGRMPRVFFNASFERAFTDRVLVQGQAVGELSDPLWKAIREYRPDTEEHRIDINGRASWWQVAQSVLVDRDGQISGRLVMFVSTTAVRQAQHAARASEDTLQALMEPYKGFLWRSRISGEPTWINHQARQHLGLEEAGDVRLRDIFPAVDLAVMASEIQTHLTQRQSFEIHTRLRCADDKYRWALLHFTPLTDLRGRVQGWAGSGLDIDDWHRAATLAARQLMDQSDDLRPAFDRYGRDVFCWIAEVETGRLHPLNPRGGHEWGLDEAGPGELWADWLARLPIDQRERADDTFSRAAEGEVVEDVWMMTNARGEEQQVRLIAFPIPDAQGTIRKIGGVLLRVGNTTGERVYLVDLDEASPTSRDELGRALGAMGVCVKRVNSLDLLSRLQGDMRPGVVVVRVRQRCEALLNALPLLAGRRGSFPWIAYTQYPADVRDVVEMMRHGAHTVLPQEADRSEIVAAIRAAMPVREVVSLDIDKVQDRIASLSLRERQVMEGLVAGGTNKSIASTLNLSPRTVETHRAALMDRLGARSLADLLRMAQPKI